MTRYTLYTALEEVKTLIDDAKYSIEESAREKSLLTRASTKLDFIQKNLFDDDMKEAKDKLLSKDA